MEKTFAHFLESHLFTFTVGSEEARDFVVHSGVIAQHSVPLSNLMNGSMIEAQARCATLEDVDVETFRRFCEFAYLCVYTDPSPEEWKDCSDDTNSNEVGIEVSQSSKPAAENCETNLWGRPQDTSFNTSSDWDFWSTKPKKDKKYKKGHEINSAQLEPCPMAESEGYIPWLKKQSGPLDSRSRKYYIVQSFSERKYILGPSPSGYPPSPWQVPSGQASRNFSPVLIGHARLYVFADKYDIANLKILALKKLHAILDGYKVDSRNVLAVIDLIKFAFDSDNTVDLDGSVDPLRGLIVHYVVSQSDTLSSNSLFEGLVEKGGPFVRLLWAVTQKAIIRDI